MTIFTVTLNPTFDRHCYIEHFATGHEFLATETDINAGGKGVNISRALAANGVDNCAVVVTGADNSADFCSRLDADGVRYYAVTVPGKIRENLTVHTASGEETRISFNGCSADKTVLDRVYAWLSERLTDGDVVTLTGRLSNGLPMEDVHAFIGRLHTHRVRLVIDSRSFDKEDLITAKPWLIKPNQEEIATYLDRVVDGFDDALGGAKELCSLGIEHVMVSLGEQGAMLVTANEVYVADAPRVTVQSTVGAGDSSVAGFLAAMQEGYALADCLKHAVAFGSAACETAGTNPPTPDAVSRLLTEITVKEVL